MRGILVSENGSLRVPDMKGQRIEVPRSEGGGSAVPVYQMVEAWGYLGRRGSLRGPGCQRSESWESLGVIWVRLREALGVRGGGLEVLMCQWRGSGVPVCQRGRPAEGEQ